MKTFPTLLFTIAFSAGCSFVAESKVIEPPMVTIPSGSFLMGNADGQENEKPVREVKIKGFMMGKYEVTIAEFKHFVAATNYPMPESCVHEAGPYWFLRPVQSGNGFELAVTTGSWDNNAISDNEFEPVVCVGWKAAQAYVAWLKEETGKPYRLPSEAEWEYANRAGSSEDYFFGGREEIDQICDFANVADKYGEEVAGDLFNAGYGGRPEACNDKSGLVSIVGLYQPNAFGLYDTFGNVEEWVQDCYVDNYQQLNANGEAVELNDCKQRVIRGGSWHYLSYTASQRTGREGDDFVGVLEGFRVALDGQNIAAANSTLHFERRLNKAQAKQQKQMAAQLDFPKQPTGLKAKKNQAGNIELNWHKDSDPTTAGYDVYRSESYFNESHKIASNVTDAEFIDYQPIKGRARYRIKAVNAQRMSDWSKEVVVGNSKVHSLPGKVQAEAYYSAPNAVISASVSEPEGDRGYLHFSDSKADYQIETTSDGSYNLTLRMFSNGKAQPVDIWLGNRLLATLKAPEKRGWHSVVKTGVAIAKGEQVISVQSKAPNFAFNWLQLTKQ